MKFRFPKIPISIEPSFWILSIIIGWMSSGSVLGVGAWIVVVFVSVLFHELGHALTSVLCGQNAEIVLSTFGGITIRRGKHVGKGYEFLIVLMGPMFGLLLAGAAYLALGYSYAMSDLTRYFFQILLFANLFWTMLNLLPVHPLDGGKLMSIVFEVFLGNVGITISYLLSGICAIATCIMALAINQLIIAALFLLFSFENFRSWSAQRRVQMNRETENAYQNIIKAETEWQDGYRKEALHLLEKTYKGEKVEAVRNRALEDLANFHMQSGHAERAYELLIRHNEKLSGNLLRYLQLASFQLGHWEVSLQSGEKCFTENGDGPCAVLNALASAHLGNVQMAINWLMSASMSGAVDIKEVVASEDFDMIRNDPNFVSFVQRYQFAS